MRKSIRNDSLVLSIGQADHSVSLAAAGLPVGEDGTIVASNDRFDQRETRFIVDLSLGGINPVHCIVSEEFFLGAACLSWPHYHLHCRLINVADALTTF